MWIAVTFVSLIAIGAGIWFTPLRGLLLRCIAGFDRYKFTSRVELVVDETEPINQDTFFYVQMIGKVPIPHDDTDTNIRVELNDITESRFEPDPVLSVDEQYQAGDGPDFHFEAHNGIIPNRNAVINPWKTILKIPTHQLRFARRGNRKLLFKISVLSCDDDEVLVSDQKAIDYVYCRDGYRELRQRKLDVLKASIRLAMLVSVDSYPLNQKVKQLFIGWIEQKSQVFPAAIQLTDCLDAVHENPVHDVRQAVECIMAYGEQTDKFAAVELAINTMAIGSVIKAGQFLQLSGIVDQLQLSRERFLALCQKILLFAPCTLQAPALLLGIDESMDENAFRIRLNEEYRKWNARVTHPDEKIRRQADRILSLIAELRSDRLGAKVS